MADSSHPTPSEFLQYSRSALAPADLTRIDDHIFHCIECSQKLSGVLREEMKKNLEKLERALDLVTKRRTEIFCEEDARIEEGEAGSPSEQTTPATRSRYDTD